MPHWLNIIENVLFWPHTKLPRREPGNVVFGDNKILFAKNMTTEVFFFFAVEAYEGNLFQSERDEQAGVYLRW